MSTNWPYFSAECCSGRRRRDCAAAAIFGMFHTDRVASLDFVGLMRPPDALSRRGQRHAVTPGIHSVGARAAG